MPINKNIFLTGFMGSGKTTVGLELARILGYSFTDTDSVIEKQSGLTVEEIFTTQGEAAFRNLEKNLLRDFVRSKKTVISLGGGIPLTQGNREILKKGYWIFLKTSAAVIEQRLRQDLTRPLLSGADKRHTIEQLLKQRLPVYQLAPCHFLTDHQNPGTIAKHIIQALRKHK